jgi:hypothetical protein
MRVGIAADHAVFAMKEQLTRVLREFGHEVWDFGLPNWSDFRKGIPAGRSIAATSWGWQQTDNRGTAHKTSCL